jgi:hypothetical protein
VSCRSARASQSRRNSWAGFEGVRCRLDEVRRGCSGKISSVGGANSRRVFRMNGTQFRKFVADAGCAELCKSGKADVIFRLADRKGRGSDYVRGVRHRTRAKCSDKRSQSQCTDQSECLCGPSLRVTVACWLPVTRAGGERRGHPRPNRSTVHGAAGL